MAHNNTSGISPEEIKKARKELGQTNSQSAYPLIKGRLAPNTSKLPPETAMTNDNNFNTSFTESDLDMPQNVEECDKDTTDHHFPHIANISNLDISAAHSINTYKAGLSSAKGQQKRFTVDPAHPQEEVI